MRRLILMRHAKSSWANEGQADIDRPLNDRGARDAPRVGVWLRDHGYLPDLALVSTSRRTRETWAGVVSTLGERPAEFLPDLYHAHEQQLLRILRAATQPVVMILAHHPGIADFSRRVLTETAIDPDFAKYPTAAAAVIDFDLDAWAEAGWGGGWLIDFTVPRRLE